MLVRCLLHTDHGWRKSTSQLTSSFLTLSDCWIHPMYPSLTQTHSNDATAVTVPDWYKCSCNSKVRTLQLTFLLYFWPLLRHVKKGTKAARKEQKLRQANCVLVFILGRQIHMAPSLKSRIILNFYEHIHIKKSGLTTCWSLTYRMILLLKNPLVEVPTYNYINITSYEKNTRLVIIWDIVCLWHKGDMSSLGSFELFGAKSLVLTRPFRCTKIFSYLLLF